MPAHRDPRTPNIVAPAGTPARAPCIPASTPGPYIKSMGEMGAAAESILPTLVNLYREEDVPADRLALARAIKKIDPKAALKLGIK